MVISLAKGDEGVLDLILEAYLDLFVALFSASL